MTLPFALPAWVPWWVQLVILVAAVLVAGAFILMPFSVFGVKARLEAIDTRLDELQADLRDLAYRLPDVEARRPAAWRRAEPDDDGYVARPAPLRRDLRDEPPRRPPIPPPPAMPDRDGGGTARRAEPQLRWPEER